MDLYIKRVYDEPARGDGFRVLVDRLWPRGLTKERGELEPHPVVTLLHSVHDAVQNHAVILREALEAGATNPA